jgi:hypothetical protein
MNDLLHPSITMLPALLDAEYDALCEYIRLSEAENDALVASDAEKIHAFTQQKRLALETLVTARNATRAAIGEPITTDLLSRKLRAAGPACQAVFEQIMNKAREALEINRISSRLVAHQSLRIRQRSELLATGSLTPGSGYTASGFYSVGKTPTSFGNA